MPENPLHAVLLAVVYVLSIIMCCFFVDVIDDSIDGLDTDQKVQDLMVTLLIMFGPLTLFCYFCKFAVLWTLFLASRLLEQIVLSENERNQLKQR